MELKVALCQFDMVWEDTAANLRTAGRMVAEADADLVILPEMFATGFVTDPGRVAQPMSGEIVQEMTRWVRTTGKAVAGSLIVEEEGRYYNRLLFIKPSGERVQSDKRHLFSIGGEGANFCPGAGRRRIRRHSFPASGLLRPALSRMEPLPERLRRYYLRCFVACGPP